MKCLSHDKGYESSVSSVVTTAHLLILSKCILDTTTVIGRTPDYHIPQLPVGLCNNDTVWTTFVWKSHSETSEEVIWGICLTYFSCERDGDANVTSTFWTDCSNRKKIPMFLSYYLLAFLSDFTVPFTVPILLYRNVQVSHSLFPSHSWLSEIITVLNRSENRAYT